MLSFEKEKLHMPLMYREGIERGNDKTFIIYQRANGKYEEYSYNYILQQANALIEKMKNVGLQKGDCIAVVSSLRPWWYSLSYACLCQGYIMVCIDPGVPGVQLQNMMLQTEIKACFTTLKTIHLPAELNEHIPLFAIDEDFPLLSKCEKIDPLLSSYLNLPKETFFILFSSGTTSENRKAVLLDHSTITKGIEYGMAKDAQIYRNTTAYTPRECDLMLFPPYHIAGLLCLTYDIYCNTKVIMLERLTPSNLVNALHDLKPDNICTVPSMLSALYNKIVVEYSKNLPSKIYVKTALNISGFLRKNFGIKLGRILLSSINKKAFGGNMKGFMIGASPFDKTANKFYLDMGIDVSMAFGLTELGAPLATSGQGYYPGTTGRVIKHNNDLDIRIVNKDSSGKGEVEVLSPYKMISYLDEKDNIGCFTDDGYFKTGDLGYFDKNNCLIISGRSKESIVLRNGEKLLPEEIESKYQNMNCVEQVVAFKVPSEGGCDDFCIAIIKKKEKGIPDDAMKIIVFDRAERLPSMYRPKEVYVLKEFPLSSSHKVQRFRLTEMVVNGDSEPVTDASMIIVDEDKTTAELRKILIKIAGSSWKTKILTQGLLLDLDSLTTVNLYVAIQDKWDIDLFQTSNQPETFGELLDIIKNFDEIDKNDKNELDLSKFPLPISKFDHIRGQRIQNWIKNLYHVKGFNIENLPKENGYLICANHRTTLDPAFIMATLPKEVREITCIVGKAELVNDKKLWKYVATQNFIPIDRTGNSIQTLDRCRELLLQGYNIIIFPEGTNLENNIKLMPLKDGAIKLSINTKCPIVPVHISGFKYLDNEVRSFQLPSIMSKVTVKFGQPILPNNMSIKELSDLLSESIQKLD